MHFSITGQRGEVGSFVADALENAGHSVSVVGEGAVGRVLHLAAKRPTATPEEIKRSNIDFVKTSIEWAEKNGVKEFIFFSTNSLYATYDKENISEDIEAPAPSGAQSDPYTLSKWAGEEMLRQSSIERCLVVRLPGVLEIKNTTALLPRMREKLLRSEPIVLINSNRKYNNFISLPDIARFVSTVELKKGFDVVNLAAPRTHSLLEIATQLKVELASTSQINLNFERKPFFSVSTHKLQSEYGFTPTEVTAAIGEWCRIPQAGI